jgi:hypothetical protein
VKRSGVALRLLPLLDITLILLGMFMLMLALTQMRASGSHTATQKQTTFGYHFVNLYYGTAGDERARRYTMDTKGRPDKELPTADAFNTYLRTISPKVDRQKTVVVLFISADAFDNSFREPDRQQMEEEIELPVLVIYNYTPERTQ